MIIEPARRTNHVQEYYFSRKLKEIAAINRSNLAAGLPSVINLGIGAPDGMPPEAAIETLTVSARRPDVHAYQSYVGIEELRSAMAAWYRHYYGVTLDPSCEIQPLVGSKEGILLTALAFVNPGDGVLVPDPGYPAYTSASHLAEARILNYDLVEANRWQPDFEALEKEDLSGVKIMWVNYPHMPTGAPASPELFARIVDFARRHGILVVNDNPYSFILNDHPLSILSIPGAKDCCLELNSLSKAHNMSGWRMGMLLGDRDLVAQVLKVKSQMDSGMFKPLQLAAVEALAQDETWFRQLNEGYARRRVLAEKIFHTLGASFDPASTGLFLWGRIDADNPFAVLTPDESKSLGERVSDTVLRETDVFITPGFIFGKNGRSYVRISLCAREEVLETAAQRISSLLKQSSK